MLLFVEELGLVEDAREKLGETLIPELSQWAGLKFPCFRFLNFPGTKGRRGGSTDPQTTLKSEGGTQGYIFLPARDR